MYWFCTNGVCFFFFIPFAINVFTKNLQSSTSARVVSGEVFFYLVNSVAQFLFFFFSISPDIKPFAVYLFLFDEK